jgi:hypothetical protein
VPPNARDQTPRALTAPIQTLITGGSTSAVRRSSKYSGGTTRFSAGSHAWNISPVFAAHRASTGAFT